MTSISINGYGEFCITFDKEDVVEDEIIIDLEDVMEELRYWYGYNPLENLAHMELSSIQKQQLIKILESSAEQLDNKDDIIEHLRWKE